MLRVPRKCISGALQFVCRSLKLTHQQQQSAFVTTYLEQATVRSETFCSDALAKRAAGTTRATQINARTRYATPINLRRVIKRLLAHVGSGDKIRTL